MTESAFFAYPDSSLVKTTVSQCTSIAGSIDLKIRPWEKMQILGLKIDNLIREEIDQADFLLADITIYNFNVYYEIGFALGRDKHVIPTVNESYTNSSTNVSITGLFDTFGQLRYQNANELIEKLSGFSKDPWSRAYKKPANHNQPLFVLDCLKKTDHRNMLFEAISHSSIAYRVFDPGETPRLSCGTALQEISSSVGVIIPLIATDIVNHEAHNLRAGFLAGLAHGMGVDTLIIQFEDRPAPIDCRDFVDTVRSKRELDQSVGDFCQQALISNQRPARHKQRAQKSLLEKIDLGSSAAENEYQKLDLYFINTAEYLRARKTTGSLVVGRKGSGKTALFYKMISDKMDDKRTLIVELNPASHSLSELREHLQSVLSLGVFDHTMVAFWQYILYFEIMLKLRETIIPRARFNLTLLELVRDIEVRFNLNDAMVSADFTSRLEMAVKSVINGMSGLPTGSDYKKYLTNILYEDKLSELRDCVVKLSNEFEDVLILFDNLDKGWPARGVESDDVRIIRHLCDTMTKMQRELSRKRCTLKFLIFLRSDVYEQLVQETADRGKYNPIVVDWSDPEQLTRIIVERLLSSFEQVDENLLMRAANPVIQNGLTVVDLLIANSLMRPRFLIDLYDKALSFAINRAHEQITSKDVEDALNQHSLYLVSYFGFELRDVSGVAEKIFYKFIGKGDLFLYNEIETLLAGEMGDISVDRAIDLFLWYGFLGIPNEGGSGTFIYDRDYDMSRLDAERKELGSEVMYVVNPAFLRGLTKSA